MYVFMYEALFPIGKLCILYFGTLFYTSTDNDQPAYNCIAIANANRLFVIPVLFLYKDNIIIQYLNANSF